MCYLCLTVVWKLYFMGNDTAWNHNAGYHLLTRKNPRNHAESSLIWSGMVLDFWGSFEKQPPLNWPRKAWVGGQLLASLMREFTSPFANPLLLKSLVKVAPLKWQLQYCALILLWFWIFGFWIPRFFVIVIQTGYMWQNHVGRLKNNSNPFPMDSGCCCVLSA